MTIVVYEENEIGIHSLKKMAMNLNSISMLSINTCY